MTSYLLSILMLSGAAVINGQVVPVPTDAPMKCELLQVEECNQLGYNLTYLPNLRGHTSQEEAYDEFGDFLPLVFNRCSNAILHFLCGFYFPVCFGTATAPVKRLNPCRTICDYVEPNCSKLLIQNKYVWPDFFNCSLEQSFTVNSTLCFGQNNLNTTKIPDYIFALSSTEPAVTTANSIALVSSMWIICLFVPLQALVKL